MVAMAGGKPLSRLPAGRICWVCVGNVDAGDDAAAILLGRRLIEAKVPGVRLAGLDPEDCILGELVGRYDHVVFVDAADFGAEPGDVTLLDANEMGVRFPQVSTHRLSLGLLAAWVEASGHTRAWLLAIQPESLRPARDLTRSVRETVESLATIVIGEAGEWGVGRC